MGNPYGGYTPAEALRDTGNSLADMMKSLLAVKVENAKLDVEGKRLDLETAKTRGGIEKDLSLQQLAGEKDLADIRYKGQEQELKRESQASEAGYRDRLAGVWERRAGVDEAELGMKQREETRLNREDSYGNMVMGSNLPAAVKKIIKSNADPEEWGRKTTVREFKSGVEEFFKQNPNVMLGGLVMGLGLKLRQAEEKIKGAKSEEEVSAIFERELEPAAYHMMELRMMLGDGPDMSEKDRSTYAQLGMKAYAASPENYKDAAEAIQKAVTTGAALKKAYWEEKFPAKEKRKEKAMEAFREGRPETYGYEIREVYPGEREYFKKNPEVAGMATEDGKIILNPNSKLTERERRAVAQNEAVRLYLQETNANPNFQLTPEQKTSLKGTPYENDETAAKHTIIARIVSGDPSAKNVTQEQKQLASQVEAKLQQRVTGKSDPKAAVMGKLNELEGMSSQLEQSGLSLDKVKKNVQKAMAAGNMEKARKTLDNAFEAAKKAKPAGSPRNLAKEEERQLSAMQGVPLGLTGGESMGPVLPDVSGNAQGVKESLQDVLAGMDERTQTFKEDVSKRVKSASSLRDILKYGK